MWGPFPSAASIAAAAYPRCPHPPTQSRSPTPLRVPNGQDPRTWRNAARGIQHCVSDEEGVIPSDALPPLAVPNRRWRCSTAPARQLRVETKHGHIVPKLHSHSRPPGTKNKSFTTAATCLGQPKATAPQGATETYRRAGPGPPMVTEPDRGRCLPYLGPARSRAWCGWCENHA
jgi:hypothetical protein